MAQNRSIGPTQVLEISDNMQNAQFQEPGQGNARRAFRTPDMECGCCQPWNLQPQALPIADILSVFFVFLRILRVQQLLKSQHHEDHGVVWAPISFLIHTYEVPAPLQTLSMLRSPKVRIEGPIMLMMLARNKLPPNPP